MHCQTDRGNSISICTLRPFLLHYPPSILTKPPSLSFVKSPPSSISDSNTTEVFTKLLCLWHLQTSTLNKQNHNKYWGNALETCGCCVERWPWEFLQKDCLGSELSSEYPVHLEWIILLESIRQATNARANLPVFDPISYHVNPIRCHCFNEHRYDYHRGPSKYHCSKHTDFLVAPTPQSLELGCPSRCRQNSGSGVDLVLRWCR